ncbi:MAG TPA: IPT/TIG domain-containing protein [Puia sp.]|nr:IPT/TIG domain-containing protein [Puia sp.]
MSRQFKSFLYLSTALLLLAIWEQGCKKKDVFPSQTVPQLKSVSPASAIPGTTVVLKGANLKNVSDVRFGTAEAAKFNASSNTDTSITVVVPDSLPAGNLFVQVYLQNGTGYSAFKFTVLTIPPVPKISSASPATGYPGDVITISGTNFALVTSVTFGGIAASFKPTLDTNGKMQAIIPANATGGNQFIKLTNSNGADSVAFNVDLSPVILSVTPGFAKPGDTVTVKGVRFKNVNSVKVNSVAAPYKVVNDSVILADIPANATTGKITVSDAVGTGTSPLSFTVQVPVTPITIYDDALAASWWTGGTAPAAGWSNISDLANATPVKSGTKSISVTYTGTYGGFQIGNGGASIDLSVYTVIKLSIYGGPGTAGKQVKLYLNSLDTKGQLLQLTEGAWTDYTVSISDLGGPATLDVLQVQEFSGATPVIYIDNIIVN